MSTNLNQTEWYMHAYIVKSY